MRRVVRAAPALVLAGILAGCEALTAGEAAATVAAAKRAWDAEALALATIDLASRVDPGTSPEEAAAEAAAGIAAALPCASTELDGATLTIVFGASAGDCDLEGRTLAGTQAIAYEAGGAGGLRLTHEWDALSDGATEVTGGASSGVGGGAGTIALDLAWTDLEGGAVATGSAVVSVTPLDGGGAAGFALAGEHSFVDDRGAWTMRVEHAEMRYADPCPESGGADVDTPFGETVALTYERASSIAVAVVAASGRERYHFEISTERNARTGGP